MRGNVGSVSVPGKDLTPSAVSAAFTLLAILADVGKAKKMLGQLADAKMAADEAAADADAKAKDVAKREADVAKGARELQMARDTFEGEAARRKTQLDEEAERLDARRRTDAEEHRTTIEALDQRDRDLKAAETALATKQHQIEEDRRIATRDRNKAAEEVEKAEAVRAELEDAKKRAAELARMKF